MDEDLHLQHDGLSFRYRLDGPEGAPWMVCSNSLVTDLNLWEPQVDAFAGRFRMLRYDQRGHGGTSVPPAPATMQQLADDAAALMRSLGIEGATWIGVSMGAGTGLCLAQRHPGLLSRIVAADGPPATAPGAAAAWEQRIELARRDGMDAYAAVTLVRWFGARSQAEQIPAIDRVRTMIETTPFEGFTACARALQSFDLRPHLGLITQKVLLLAGAEDAAMPKTLQALTGDLPDASFATIADAGHLPGIERPEAFNAAVERLLG